MVITLINQQLEFKLHISLRLLNKFLIEKLHKGKMHSEKNVLFCCIFTAFIKVFKKVLQS